MGKRRRQWAGRQSHASLLTRQAGAAADTTYLSTRSLAPSRLTVRGPRLPKRTRARPHHPGPHVIVVAWVYWEWGGDDARGGGKNIRAPEECVCSFKQEHAKLGSTALASSSLTT